MEKTLFSYRTMYIHPLPEFEIKNEKWVGCFFGYAQPLDQTIKIPLIGIAISDVEYARLIHGLLLKWTMGELNDNAKNITVRVIVDNPQEYVFYLYPNILKQNAQKFYESVERERKKESLSDIHHRFAVTQILGKRCEIFANSFFSQFRHLYKPGDPCHFQIRLQLANGATEEIPDLEGFLIHDFAIMEKSELTRKDLEYELDKILR
ncbi:MAG: hypothetical protein H8E26_03100 [FCB group bacterium]|nr:hypothetical protein [FCB group bacterium]